MRTYIENILDYLASSHAEDSIGSVDELGHFAVVSIPTDQVEREAFLSKLDDELGLERDPNEPTLEGGWYVVLTDSNGYIGYAIADDEANAWSRFNKIVAQYTDYYGEVED